MVQRKNFAANLDLLHLSCLIDAPFRAEKGKVLRGTKALSIQTETFSRFTFCHYAFPDDEPDPVRLEML